MEQQKTSLLPIIIVVGIVLYIVMQSVGPHSWLMEKWNSVPATGATDFHSLAREDAVNAGIDPNLFSRQINQESGWNPNAVSPAGAIGIAQFEPTTAKGLGIDPWNAEQSLQGAASLMSRYVAKYGNYSKALAAYNYGSANTDSAIARCGWGWKACVPAETRSYIMAVMS
jgi:soluble lytic murein transglycosylase-like protein